MTPREYWNSYVERLGGPAAVAEHLCIPYSTIAAICNGTRGIGRVTARRMVEADPALDRKILLWVEAETKPFTQTTEAPDAQPLP